MWLLAGLMATALVVGRAGAQESFEYLTYTPPPGWSVSHADGGRQYVHNEPGGIGIISLLASRPAGRTPADEFGDIWRAHATKILSGPPPLPAVQQVGDVTLAMGTRQIGSPGTTVRVVVVAVLHGDRVLGVVGTATGPQRQAELDTFFGSVGVEPIATEGATAPADNPAGTAAGEALPSAASELPAAGTGTPSGADDASPSPAGELGFEVPAGYVLQHSGDVILLVPTAPDRQTPCVYGVAPARPATTSLEADAEAALLETVVPGWRRLDDRHAAMRGTAAAGWPYVWYRAAFDGELGGERQAVNAMALVFPAGEGHVHVVWGLGGISRCLLDDTTFERLFHSLRPPGWTSDGGRALADALVGAWRYTASVGLQQLTFHGNGRFDRDLGSRAQLGVSEQTSATATGGTFTLQDGELVLAPDHRPRSPDRYYARVYDEWFLDRWKPVLALFDATASPPVIIPYYRVEEPR